MTYDQHCAILPLALPGQGCNGSGNGSITVNGAEIPIPCNSTIEDSEGNAMVRTTQDWKEVMSPSGQVSLTCKFK